MAYRRTVRRYPARRRPTRKGYSRYRSPRSYTAKRRVSRRPAMSRKRILNMTSRKKHDTMRNYTNLTAVQQGGETYIATATIIPGNQLFGFLWSPTSRGRETGQVGNDATVDDQASRTATTCYMRGIKEKIQIQTSSGVPWQWRRICFTLKGNALATLQATYAKLSAYTSNGYMRVTNDFNGFPAQRDELFGLIFQGANNVDWHNYFSAKTDNLRATIKYDKTMIIQSGNQSGIMRCYNRWHPMNKNLVYDDQERGGSSDASGWSTDGKAGMGDYYILDLIGSGSGSTSSDKLSWDPTSTLYWHEK